MKKATTRESVGIWRREETLMYREKREEKREKKVKSKCGRNASNVQLIKLVTWELILQKIISRMLVFE